MITEDDPTSAGSFRLPSPETLAGFDDDQLERAADRAPWELARSGQRFAIARLTAVLLGAGAVIAVLALLGVFPSIEGDVALTVAAAALVLVFAASVVVAIATKRSVRLERRREPHRRRDPQSMPGAVTTITVQPGAPEPNTDDLLRAAAWLEDQADEADTVASAFTGEASSTREAVRTRATATWLRHKAGQQPALS